MITLRIATAGKETGALLEQYLRERGTLANDYHEKVVCYGSPYSGRKPALNRNCGTSKIERLEMFKAAGVSTVPWFSADSATGHGVFEAQYPLLARKAVGYGGTDIVPVFQPEELEWRIAAGWDWFSSYVPIETEGRIWIFRDEILDCYQKVMERPNEYVHVGRNFRNGFEFRPWRYIPNEIGNEALNAVMAIGLDFAAVDILLGKDGKPYVLEANTAPGVLRSRAEATLAKLADRIADWDSQS